MLSRKITSDRAAAMVSYTLADHAEAWAKENGETVPPRDTPEWLAMYERWHGWAFAEFTQLLKGTAYE